MMRYGSILADPPWAFRNYSGADIVPARGEQPYRTMSLTEIAALPVSKYAADDCALYLWQSDSLPHAAQQLAEAWGFKVVTDNVFIWIKPSIGMGYWSRKEAETVALLKRGKPPRLSKGVRQVIYAPRREHSRKPDDVYTRIRSLTDGPYLELFARQQYQGWDSWGDETAKFTVAA